MEFIPWAMPKPNDCCWCCWLCIPPYCPLPDEGVLKKAMGSCLNPLEVPPSAGLGEGDGALKRSRGSPEAVIAWFELDAEAALESLGRDKPPSPDIGASSAKTSKEMRSAAFWFGLLLCDVSFHLAPTTYASTKACALAQSPALQASYLSNALLIRSLQSSRRS